MKTYTLKEATFTAEIASAADIRDLSDTELEAVMKNAMASWAYRRGARAESHGKHYDLKAIVADMLACGERGGEGGMTKADEKEITALFKAHGLTCADDIVRGFKTEAEKDAAVAKFAQHHALDASLLDPEAAASDNAVTAFQAACSAALDADIARWNSRVSSDGRFDRDPDATTLASALAFIRAKRRFIKSA